MDDTANGALTKDPPMDENAKWEHNKDPLRNKAAISSELLISYRI